MTTEELEDFDTDFVADSNESLDDSYLSGMWSRAGFRRSNDHIDDTLVAHGMVQSFVDAFSAEDHYKVSFGKVATAGTDLRTKSIVITSAPIIDPKLTPEQAGLILTGLAVHEVCHPRYGKDMDVAVQLTFPRNRTAHTLSNLLEDIRIERKFVTDYPGYAGIFAPVLDYVSGDARVDMDVVIARGDLVGVAINACRYPTKSVWSPASEGERDWWQSWAARWSREDSPRRHVDGIREALARVAAATKPATESPSSDKGDATPDPSPEASQSGPEPVQNDYELNEQTRQTQLGQSEYAEPNAAAKERVIEDGASRYEVDYNDDRSQAVVTSAENSESDGAGILVDVARSLRGISRVRAGVPSEVAAAHIAGAILRSRTGNTETSQYRKSGRLDQRGLARTALGDTRVFERRTAPSPGKYLVWVMVDASYSMNGRMEDASGVVHAMAVASRHVPTIRMDVWAWSDPFRPSVVASAGVVHVWGSGEDPTNIFRMSGLDMNNTPDAPVMRWSARAIRREARRDERPVIIFVSDGQGLGDMDQAVETARKSGVDVYSVSFGNELTEDMQVARFGRGNVVPFAGTITNTARGLADLFARITSR